MLGQDLSPVELSDFLDAQRRLRQSFPPSPLLSMAPLDQQLGFPVYLKAESLLPSGAYKIRGATNKIMSLLQEVGPSLQIITASSGNHGMACALAASRMGVPVTIVVPEPTPDIKKNSIRAMGARLLEIGATYDESFLAAVDLAEKEKMYYVHPTSDRYTVAGQGTISLELLRQIPDIDQIVVPIGGGGLITGISYVLKHLRPSVRVVGVMPEGSAVYAASRAAGELVTLDSCASMADAVVRKTGEPYLYPYIEKYVDEIVTVSEEQLRAAVKTASLYAKLTLEGAAALALAAIMSGKCAPTEHTVLLCSGGNIDGSVLLSCLQG